MTMKRHTHKLTGCAPAPLASYLKALGILRLVAEQVDATAQGWWEGDVFYLRTSLDRTQLAEFFVDCYRPTPVVAPWNGGSGFYSKDNQDAISQIEKGKSDRLASYRETIFACRALIKSLKLKQKPDGDNKEEVLKACRNHLSDETLEWIDAAFVLTNDGPKYPPLLGTGGNDGRLEFTNNFMQRLLDLMEAKTGEHSDSSKSWWSEAFFAVTQNDLQRDSILGQFDPGAIERAVNPWDYVLMIEGAIVFAASAVKRHEFSKKGVLSYPFCVRAVGVGYGSAASADEDSSRAEIWLPLWAAPCRYSEVAALFAEGRAQLCGRTAKNGVDFARAVSTLGTDRGIDEFARMGFHARNGLAYFAVPLGRFNAVAKPQVNLLVEIDLWLDGFRRAASGENSPSRAKRVLRRVESSILDLCQRKGVSQLQAVLVALGEAEAVLATAPKWREEAYQNPVPLLSPQWLTDSDDNSPEFRLAASLAGMWTSGIGSLRQHLEAIEAKGRWIKWSEGSDDMCKVVWSEAALEDNLIAVIQRRAIEVIQSGDRIGNTAVFSNESSYLAALSDVELFLKRETDDQRISELVRGLVLLDWNQIRREGNIIRSQSTEERAPDSTFALLKLCHSSYPIGETYVRLEPAIVRLAASGRLNDATKLAARRLLGSGLPPAVSMIARNGPNSRRIAAALLFPLGWNDINALASTVLKPQRETQSY